MGVSDLFAQNVLLRWLRGRGAPHDLALSMAGVRLGERVAQIGLGDGGLFVALAGKVGYTGRACGVDDRPAAIERARRAAERAGVLIELEQAPPEMLPLDEGAFDLVVVLAAGGAVTAAPGVFREALRVLRPGGRCVTIASVPRGGVFGTIAAASGAAGPAGYEMVGQLRQAGFKASRQLAIRKGTAFFEATKAASPS